VSSQHAIEIDGVSKSYGDVQALQDVSLSIQEGEIFGLLGPNGSGKTTMINCITQLADRDGGDITVMGLDLDEHYNEVRKRIGLSLQEPQADLYFSIRRTLIYQAGYFGIPSDQAGERVDELLKGFDLYEKRDENFRELSGGMQRKVSLIKALLHEPDILILDEPTAALDVEARHDLWDHVRRVNDDGMTILLTTHYIEEAEAMCDRICFLRDGTVLKIDSKDTIMQTLSQNKITFSFHDKIPSLPQSFPDHRVLDDRNEVEITVAEKDQSRVLRTALDSLDDASIDYHNFTIEQDRLENIFRRVIWDE
jgi:ABC-2 type transport system ATP-binding protein